MSDSNSNTVREARGASMSLGRLQGRVARVLARILGRLQRLVMSPKPISSPDGKVRIHLGCGDVDAPGFINVDLKPAPHVHHVHSVSSLPFLGDESADLVYACHVLEHFPIDDLRGLLLEWRRVIKKGGVLRLSVPDFDLLLKIYGACGNRVDSIQQPLMGHNDGYNSHLAIFNHESLRQLLVDAGFHDVRVWDPTVAPDHDFEDWASRKIQRDGSEFHVSLNMEASR